MVPDDKLGKSHRGMYQLLTWYRNIVIEVLVLTVAIMNACRCFVALHPR